MEPCIDSKKRLRDQSNDSLFNFVTGSKIVRFDSAESNFISPDANDTLITGSVSLDSKSIEIVHADESGLDSFQPREIQDDLLKILDEAADDSIDRESAIPDLDSVIRSFEEEILVPVVQQPELGYLLEASDDELGLPPPGQKEEIEAVEVVTGNSGVMRGFLGFEDEDVSNYGWFENLSGENEWNREEEEEEEEEVVALGGLFDHTDVTAAELPLYRPETVYCLFY